MADIKTSTDRMDTDVDVLRNLVQGMNGYCNDLLQRKNALDAMWDGPASEAFKAAFQDDITAMQTMVENMHKIYDYEDMAKEKYNQCENQISGMISGL